MNIPENQKHNFVLLCEQGHQCSPIWIDKGEITNDTFQPLFKKIPSKIDNFLGRPRELQQLYHTLNQQRFVTLKGAPGIGKTSIVKMVANSFVERCERPGFSDGILYLACMATQNTEGLLHKIDQNTKNIKDQGNFNYVGEKILHKLKDKQFLLILDGIEDILIHNIDTFREYMITLYEECQQVRILLVSRMKVDIPQEHIFELDILNPLDSVKLFKAKCGRPILKNEIGELLGQDVSKWDNNMLNEKFSQHELISMLSGHPQSITLSASLLYSQKLSQLFQSLNSNMLSTLEGEFGKIQDKNPLFSLQTSLNTSALLILNNYGEKTINFFCLFGLLPAGGPIQLLNGIFQENTEQFIYRLLDNSLIIEKEQQGQQEKWYTTYPIIQMYAENLITQDDFIYYSQVVLHYYTEKCKSIYNQIATNAGDISESLKQQIEFIIQNDENIFDCLQRKQVKQTKLNNMQRRESLKRAVTKFEPIQSQESAPNLNPKVKSMLAKGFQKNMLQASDYQEEQKQILSLVRQTLKFTKVKQTIREKQKGSLLIDQQKKQILAFIKEQQKKRESSNIGKLMSYYITILILRKEYYNAVFYISQAIPILKKEKDIENEANLFKLLAFLRFVNIETKESNIPQIMEMLENAKQGYKDAQSILGKASSNIFLSLCYLFKEDNEQAVKLLQHSIKQYSLINHKAGLSMAYKLLQQAGHEPLESGQKQEQFIQEAEQNQYQHGMGQMMLRNIFDENNLLYSLVLELPIITEVTAFNVLKMQSQNILKKSSLIKL